MNRINLQGAAEAARRQICHRARALYRNCDSFGYHFASIKLGVDPLFTDVLLSGALRRCSELVDLGCGQGLLTAWLDAARAQHVEGGWPADWPEPPSALRTRGVDLRTASIARARAALGDRAEFRVLDIRQADCSGADAVTLLDVVHYIDFPEQQRLLERIREAQPAGGVLVMRVANAGSGFQFKLAQWVDNFNDVVRDGRRSAFFCRSVEQWLGVLRRCGYVAKAYDDSAGQSFSNTMLIGHAA